MIVLDLFLKKNLLAMFLLNEVFSICGLGRDHRKRKTFQICRPPQSDRIFLTAENPVQLDYQLLYRFKEFRPKQQEGHKLVS